MSDPFFKTPSSVNAPAAHSVAIVTNDAADQAITYKAIYVGNTGDVKVELAGDTVGNAVTFKNVPNGAFLPIRARKIYTTGTTATNMVGLY